MSTDFVSLVLPHPDGEVISTSCEVVRYDNFVRNLLKPDIEPMMGVHVALGVCGEAGELADAIKKEYIYGKKRDLINIIEELGDLEFYLQAVRNHYGISRELTLQANAEKLQKRYVSLKYSGEAAIARADKAKDSGQ